METVTRGVAVHGGRRQLLAVRAYRPISVSDEPIKLWVNDEPMQDGNTGDMHFTIA